MDTAFRLVRWHLRDIPLRAWNLLLHPVPPLYISPAPAQVSRTQADPQRRYQPHPLLTRVIHEPYANDRALDSKGKSVLAEMCACARSQGVGD